MAVTRIEDVVNKDDEEPSATAAVPAPPPPEADGRLATVGKKRTRTGPENAQTMGPEHPSMRQAATTGRSQGFQIINVTKEVIRDYFEETGSDEIEDLRLPETRLPDTQPQKISPVCRTTAPIISPTFEGVTTMQDQHLSHQPSPVLALPELTNGDPYMSKIDLFLSPNYSDSAFEDGIFLPGSQYQELHAALRSRIIDTARSTVPSRVGSPEPYPPPDLHSPISVQADDDESRRLAHLTAEEEYVLWQNYISEVAPWLDKFDIARHFELVLPMLAKSHPHLRYSILALSSRQMELKAKKPDNSCSLALYQHAIHLLSPLLHQRTSVVLASCIVLCVLEMMSCSPKAWRRHLDGCAALIQALGINGGCGALDQALFWCFARMDVCGGLISSERTLIPMNKWMSGGDLPSDLQIFHHNPTFAFDMYANRVVYLCGQVIDLLCTSGKWEQRHPTQHPTLSPTTYLAHWTRLFEVLERWYLDRPQEMLPLLTIPSPSSNPFPTILYANGPAVSGNQLYHTASLLMHKHRPPHLQFPPTHRKPHSLLWHARQICAISLSNTHHGCWTNSIQPLWVAGQHMSHPSEHEAILKLLERIERETGWATKWRAEDLREFWGVGDD
ncbi:hypothetical protein PRZ48_009738 [Zasmidium cellare]|uniref:C6 transcription factor n=1 Tax=Zasmidium cellare TaxID=395010 RepID=A0ABR0ED63_ZASCE|nr:hypothetical protein PRZ48_009738 [Zasmidium cellare]